MVIAKLQRYMRPSREFTYRSLIYQDEYLSNVPPVQLQYHVAQVQWASLATWHILKSFGISMLF